MSEKLQKLGQRRERLVQEAEEQRRQLLQAVGALRAPMALADQGIAAISFMKKHPIWLAGGSALFLKIVRPSRIGKWFSRGLFAWQMVRKLRTKFLA
ncbi:MAG: YqjK-like family protein [Methylotenera sp.]